MSYILDALRRAQAERERGQVPGLEARPVADLSPLPAARPSWVLGLALLSGLLVLLLLVAAWWWTRVQPQPTAAAPTPTATEAPAAAVRAAPVTVAGPSLPVVVSAAPQPAVVAPATPAQQMPVVAPAPASSAQTVAAVPAVPTVPAGPTGPRTLRLNQLTPEQRRELPPLAVGGAIWSENAASRFLILDGQVVREGDTLAPGLVLERMAPKQAWLRWRELRIEIVF